MEQQETHELPTERYIRVLREKLTAAEAERDALQKAGAELVKALQEIDKSISKGNGAGLVRPAIRIALAAYAESTEQADKEQEGR